MCRPTIIIHITVLQILSAIPTKIGVAAGGISITVDDFKLPVRFLLYAS